MLNYEKLEDKKFKIFVNRGFGFSMGNMLDVLSGEAYQEAQKDNWIIVERKGGVYYIVDDNMTDKEGSWITDSTALGFAQWSEEVKDLDNGHSDESQCFEMSNKLQWNEVTMEIDGPMCAENIERLCEALEHVTICAWCPGDI